MRKFRIDGRRCKTLEDFYEEVTRVLIPGSNWGKNLDAFNDILYGWQGLPETGFVLIWEHSAVSKSHLGYSETVRQLEIRLSRCQPTGRKTVQREIRTAKSKMGPTVFDWLVEIIQRHAPSRDRTTGTVELRLM
jgi:RNAse (barnase) inhibitor barstar